MFHQTSVTKHIVGWERELTIFPLKGKNNLEFFVLFCFFFNCFFVFFVFVLFWFCFAFVFFVVLNFSFVKTDKEGIELWLPLGLANTLSVCK